MKHFWLIAMIVLGLGVVYKIAYPTYSCRYRMTMSVEVDGQIRSASTVNEVSVTMLPVVFHENVSFRINESGEAVFLDVGNGRNLVALLARGKNAFIPGYGSLVFHHLGINPSNRAELAKLASARGEWDVRGEELPALVTFSDLSRPSSARLVDVSQFEQVFGPDVRWRGIRVEMTGDSTTNHILSVLPWISNLPRMTLTDPNKFYLNATYLLRH